MLALVLSFQRHGITPSLLHGLVHLLARALLLSQMIVVAACYGPSIGDDRWKMQYWDDDLDHGLCRVLSRSLLCHNEFMLRWSISSDVSTWHTKLFKLNMTYISFFGNNFSLTSSMIMELSNHEGLNKLVFILILILTIHTNIFEGKAMIFSLLNSFHKNVRNYKTLKVRFLTQEDLEPMVMPNSWQSTMSINVCPFTRHTLL